MEADISKYTDLAVEFAVKVIPNLLLAIGILFAGFWVIKRLMRVVSAALEKAKFSREIITFLTSLTDIALKVLLIFSIAGMIGINTASFVAVLAAAGFAIGMALQGSLGNFAAGIIILIFRPYRVGDWVEVQDKFGKVEDIQIFNTVVVTPGQKILIIPNGQVISGVVTNFSTKGYIRMELSVSMPYSEDFPKVKEIILNELKSIDNVLKEPIPEVGIESFDSHSIILSIRPYVLPDKFWDVHFEVYEKVKAAFHSHNVKVAYSEGVEMGDIGN